MGACLKGASIDLSSTESGKRGRQKRKRCSDLTLGLKGRGEGRKERKPISERRGSCVGKRRRGMFSILWKKKGRDHS